MLADNVSSSFLFSPTKQTALKQQEHCSLLFNFDSCRGNKLINNRNYIQEGTVAASDVPASHSTDSNSEKKKTHMHTDPQRVMDRSPGAPLSECNMAFHACSPHLFGP